MIDKNTFSNPPSQYRSAPFWALNGKLEKDELKRQIREFHNQGLGGAFLHPRGGMATEYLSREFFTALHECIEEFEALSMKAWLYDEDRYPSGVAGGKVLKQHPDSAQKFIIPQISDVPENKLHDHTFAFFLLKGNTYEKISPDSLPASGTIFSVSLGKGIPMARFNHEPMVDICNKDAMDAFIHITHDKYYEELGKSFGESIPAIFTDEPHFKPPVKNALPWTRGFEEKFFIKNGYDIIGRLPELFLNIGNYTQSRFDYWDLLSSLAVESFSKNIYHWCGQKGIAYTGHFWEHVFPSPINTGSVMPHYAYMQYPGIDILFVSNPQTPEMYGNDLIVKEASSVANQLGKERVLSETFGASGWGLDFAYQKRAIDWQLAMGVNLFALHLSLYSMTGYRKRDFPLSFSDHQPWWKDYRLLGDYMGRMCYALAQGKYVADVLVLHPSSSTWSSYAPLESDEKLENIGSSVKTLVKNLNQLQIMFDLGDDIIISKHGKIHNKRFTVGQMNYSVVILPSMELLRGKVYALLREFSDKGGTIIATGGLPYFLDGHGAKQLVEFLSSRRIKKISNDKASLSAFLYSCPLERVRLKETDQKDLSYVYTHIRRQDHKKTVFLCNMDMAEKVSLHMETGQPYFIEQLNGETGESRVCEVYTEDGEQYYISLTLEPLNSALFLFHENQWTEPKKETVPSIPKKIQKLSGWSLELKDKNALHLHRCSASLNNEAYGLPDDVLSIDDALKERLGLEAGNIFMRQPWMYSEEEKGNTVMVKAEYAFMVEELPKGSLMAAVELPQIFTVYINDCKVTPLDRFYKDRTFVLFDIKPFVKSGINLIRLETGQYGVLVNLESIYVVGDFKLIRNPRGFSITEVSSLTPGDLVEQGYPYYSGAVCYTAKVNIDSYFREAVFSFKHFLGVSAIVSVNGKQVRTIGWKPYHADITKHLKKGENFITLEIANSLQNLFGPFGTDCNLRLVTPNSFYAKTHEQFTPYGFDGEAVITLTR